MKLLLDTQLLLWAAGQPERLSPAARKLMDDPRNELVFSAASLWEITIKNTLGREDFRVEPRLLLTEEEPLKDSRAFIVALEPPLQQTPRHVCCTVVAGLAPRAHLAAELIDKIVTLLVAREHVLKEPSLLLYNTRNATLRSSRGSKEAH